MRFLQFFKIKPLNGLIFNLRKHRVLGGGAQTLDYFGLEMGLGEKQGDPLS